MRFVFVSAEVDEFTATVIFWIVTGVGIILYSALMLLIDGLLTAIVKKFFPHKYSPSSLRKKREVEQNWDKKSIETEFIQEIRVSQQRKQSDKSKEKLEIAISYTQHEFAPYVSDDDLIQLCQHITAYSEGNILQNPQPVRVAKLASLDLYHFGWNIWKHFSIGKQDEVALFLKLVFADALKDVEPDTIKSHLKDDEQKGLIKIQKNL
ncbi:mobilization protein [Porphyromonas circumdentaria]|uniref:mobilization protein n=1 Tax=Porphyromonas circumdentaria TaxID=29524 RepID=UPI001F2B289F|nr:mobilization protein [Porphyromonas circumdentaria]